MGYITLICIYVYICVRICICSSNQLFVANQHITSTHINSQRAHSLTEETQGVQQHVKLKFTNKKKIKIAKIDNNKKQKYSHKESREHKVKGQHLRVNVWVCISVVKSESSTLPHTQ